jgi:GntR family transcriptional regulator
MKYAQIIAQIEQSIVDGDLEPGDRLPPERALAAEHGVSRMTVRQALQSLEARGLLRRAIGRNGGSFVAQPKVERDLGTFSGLSEQLARQGVVAGARVLSAGEVDGAVEIVRVRLADGEPFAVERSSFPADRFRGLLQCDLTGSLYELLGDAAPVRAVERIEPVLADADDAAALGLRVGAPLMLVDRVAYDDAGLVVETARDVFRGDRTRIVAWTSEFGRRLDGARQGAEAAARPAPERRRTRG